MGIESVKAFIERVKTDEDFFSKVKECKDANSRMALAKAAGFDFTSEEMAGGVREMADDELENVAGGGVLFSCYENVRGWMML